MNSDKKIVTPKKKAAPRAAPKAAPVGSLPECPAPGIPATGTQAPGTPAPGTKASGAPATDTQAPDTQAPRIPGCLADSPEDFDRLAEAYFAYCKEAGEPVLLTGLALALGFCDTQALYEYRRYEEFAQPVRRALTRVEMEYERHLRTGGGTGAVFALKNFGWKDKQEMDQGGGGPPKVELILNASGTAPAPE